MTQRTTTTRMMSLLLGAALLTGGSGCGEKEGEEESGPYPGPCSEERDDGNDQSIDSRSTYEYNAQDLVSREAVDEDLDGVPDYAHLYEYDARGNETQFGYDSAPMDGVAERGYRNTYDADDNVLTWAHYEDFTATPTWQYTYTYDVNGYQTLTQFDRDANGSVEEVWTHTWNADHTVQTVEEDTDVDEVVDVVHEYTYNADGLMVSSESDFNNDGVFDSITEFEYDADGNLLRISYDLDADSVTDETVTYTYDEDGNELSYLYEASTGDSAIQYDYSCW